MEEDDIPEPSFFNPNKCIRTYLQPKRRTLKVTHNLEMDKKPLTTKNAVKFLLDGTLQRKVCRYCLNEVPLLSELDQIMQVAGKGALYKVTIREMIASFHPFKVADDPNFPNKICDKCLDNTITSYLFTQQCEQAERALRNCFDDMYEKLEKLDPLERTRKRGRQKLNPNYNILYAEHEKVINYAEPIINLIHTTSESFTKENEIKEFECLKCCQLLPNLASLLNHEKSHPKTMWYNCRLCGKSFPKRYQLKKHMNTHLREKTTTPTETSFSCKCGETSNNYNEYLQHLEKHKFKTVMENLVEKKMDKLCSICLSQSSNMSDLDNMVCLHGGCPELTGDRSLYNILASTLPDMNLLHNYTGTKICQNCVNHAITSYIFINQFYFVRNRLSTCVSIMLESLNQIVSLNSNIFIEISRDAIMPTHEHYDENLFIDENDYLDESKLKIDVLEDEFREKSDSEDSESEKSIKIEDSLDIPKLPAIKTYTDRKLVNGYQTLDPIGKVSEFLTFKTKKPKRRYTCKFTCPLCIKHFISDYFLKRHVMKHVNKKIDCKHCFRQFKSKFHLYEHTKMIHYLKEYTYLSCKTCGRTFTDRNKLISHEKHHKEKPCQLCDKMFASQKHYDSHMQRHAVKLGTLKRIKANNCSFCEKQCLNDNELSLHVNRVHLQIKPFGCDMCEKLFYTEYNLNSHKQIHSLYSKETCQFCNKILKSRKSLVIHVRKHIGDMPYNCQICGKAFYSQFRTREHMKIYHGGMFFCRFCKTAFATKFVLKDHVIRAHNIL